MTPHSPSAPGRHLRTAATALACTLLAAPAVAQELAFEDARQHMLQHSHARQAQGHDVTAWQQDAEATRALRLPRVSVTVAGVQYEKDVEFSVDGFPATLDETYRQRGVRSTVSAEWPLYAGGRIDATRTQAGARASQASAEFANHDATLTRELVDAYFGAQLAAQVKAVRESALEMLEAHRHRATRYHDEGMISQLQERQARVARDEARRELSVARRDHAKADAYLRQRLNTEQAVCPATPLFVHDAVPHPVDHYIRRGLEQHPALDVAAARARQAREQTRIERSHLLPEVFAFGTYELNADATPLTEPDWAAGVGVRWNITTELDRRQRLGAARSREAQARSADAQARADIALAIETGHRRLEQAREQFELLENDVAYARETFRLQEAAFAEGQATSLDVTEARLALARAEVERAESAFGYVTALADVLAASGDMHRFSDHIDGIRVSGVDCQITGNDQ